MANLQALRDTLGKTPRKLGWFTDPPIEMPVPLWLKDTSPKDDPIKHLYDDFRLIWKKGEVRWASVIRANQDLYESGSDDAPGDLLFSTTATDVEALENLPLLRDRLHELLDRPVESVTDEREAAWAEDMLDPMSFHRGFSLPRSWHAPGQEYQASTTMFHRGHLPGGMIKHRLMPVLVPAEPPLWAVVVPVKFWPPELLAWLDENHAIKSPSLPDGTPPPLPEIASGDSNMDIREAAYQEVFGPIDTVFHPMAFGPHVDVYTFHRKDDGPFWTLATGGMSDQDQPNSEDGFMQRVELVIHLREKRKEVAEFLQTMARYPFETGAPLDGGHIIPLGEIAEPILGTALFPNLLLIADTRMPDRAIAGKAIVDGKPMYPLMIYPITDREAEFVQAEGPDEFLKRLKESGFGPIFEPKRPCVG